MIVDRMAPYVKKKKIISQISKFKLICKYESSFTCTVHVNINFWSGCKKG